MKKVNFNFNNIERVEKTITIGDRVLKVNDSKNTMLRIMASQKGADQKDVTASMELMDNALKLILGTEGYEYVESLELPIATYNSLFEVIMNIINDKDMEEDGKEVNNTPIGQI